MQRSSNIRLSNYKKLFFKRTSPSGFCNDHFCSETVKFCPQIFWLQGYFGIVGDPVIIGHSGCHARVLSMTATHSWEFREKLWRQMVHHRRRGCSQSSCPLPINTRKCSCHRRGRCWRCGRCRRQMWRHIWRDWQRSLLLCRRRWRCQQGVDAEVWGRLSSRGRDARRRICHWRGTRHQNVSRIKTHFCWK